MRKYQSLILIITTIASLTLLVIYRNEYNRLRYVLEVFNFFGQPPQCNFPEFLNSSALIQHDWGPTPLWTTLESAHIYSAFLQNENDAVVLVVHNKEDVLSHCFLWFETQPNVVSGAVKYSKVADLDSSGRTGLYRYYCRVDSVVEAPFAVSLSRSRKLSKDLKKVLLSPVWKTKSDLTTICVVPLDSSPKGTIVEFLSYHHIVGMDSFLVYNNNVPYKLMDQLKRLSPKFGLELVELAFNDPFLKRLDLRKVLVEDCLLRTKSNSRNVLILDWTEFVVPQYHRSIPSLLQHHDPWNKTHQFRLKTFTFCANTQKDSIILDSLYYDEAKPQDFLDLYRRNDVQNEVTNTQEISTDVAAVRRYIACTMHPGHSKKDTVMLKFTTELNKSPLFRLYKLNKL